MATLPTINDTPYKVGQWLTFSDYGEAARRNMVVGWACVAGLALIVSIWLPMSALSLDRTTWPALAHSSIYAAAAYAFYLISSHRLRDKQDQLASVLRAALERFALLFRGCIVIMAIGSVGLIFSYLATAWAPPLKDGLLARLDDHFEFNWLSFLMALNEHPLCAHVLVKAYESTSPLTQFTVVWLALRGCGERLSEFLALLSLSSLGLAIGMVLVPAAGAFVYFEPARNSFDNFTVGGEMWAFLGTFNSLRDGSLTTIDLAMVQGVVSFPSFHTMLGIITTYALRDTRALFIPAVIISGTMVVSTLPVGGHYLVDVLAGAAFMIVAIYAISYRFHRASQTQPVATVNGTY